MTTAKIKFSHKKENFRKAFALLREGFPRSFHYIYEVLMGFGYMFFGCFFLVGTLGIPDIIGFILLYVGMRYASGHCTCFDNTKNVCKLGFIFSALDLAIDVSDWLDLGLFNSFVTNVFSSVYTAFLVCFYVMLFLSVANIAKEVELPKIRSSAYSNMILVPLFLFGAQIIMIYVSENAESLGDFGSQLYGTGMLLSLLATLLTAVLLFRCYARICLEGDEEMEKRAHDLKSPLDFYEKNRKTKNTASSGGNKNNNHKKKKK